MRHLSNGPEEIMCDIEMQSVSYDNLGHNEPGGWSDGDSTGGFSSQDDLINQVIAEGDDCMIDEENLFEDSISDTDMFEEISVDLQHFANSLSDLAIDNSQTGSFIKEMLEFGGSSISNLAIFNEFEDDVLEDENYFEHHDEMLVEETTANIQIFINGTNEKWEILKNSLRETSTRSVYNAKDNLIKSKSYIKNEKPISPHESISQVLKYDINSFLITDFEKDMRDSEVSAFVSNDEHHTLSNVKNNFTVYSEESLLAVLESDTDNITDSASTKNTCIESDEPFSTVREASVNKSAKQDIETCIDVYSDESLLAVLESDNDDLMDSPTPILVVSKESFLTAQESHINQSDIEKHIPVYSDETLLAVLETDPDDSTNMYVDSGESFSTLQELQINKPTEPDVEGHAIAHSDESILVELESDNIIDLPSLEHIYVDPGESFVTVKELHVDLHRKPNIEDNIDDYSEVPLSAVLESDTDNDVDDSPILKNIYADPKVSSLFAHESIINKHTESYIKEPIGTYSEESLSAVLESNTDNVVDSLIPKNIYVDSDVSLKTQESNINKSTKPDTEEDIAVYSEKPSLIVVKLDSYNFMSYITKTNPANSEESFLLESNIDNFSKSSDKRQDIVYSREFLVSELESGSDPLKKPLISSEQIFDSKNTTHGSADSTKKPDTENQLTVYSERSDSDNLTKSYTLNNLSVESEEKSFFIVPNSNIDEQNVKFSIFKPKFDDVSETKICKDIDDDSEESFLMALRSDIDHPSEPHTEKQDMFYSDESLLAVLDSDIDNITRPHVPNKLTLISGESLLTGLDGNIEKSSKRETQMNFYSEESLLAVLESDIINLKKSNIEKNITFHSDDSLLAALNSSNIHSPKPKNGNSIIFETKESLSTVLKSNLGPVKIAKRKHENRKEVTMKPILYSGISDTALTEKEDLPFTCDVCGLKFRHASYLMRHKTIHNEVKDFECDKCNYKCKNVWALDTHKKLHTDEKPFSCKLCDYKCKTAGYLKAHKVKHSKVTPFSCPACDLKFKTSRMLKFHKMIHDDESKLTCDVCNKKFTSPTNLKSHKIIHNDEAPLTCDQCSFSCKNLSYLTRHKKTHTQQPLACGLCSYECNSISSLKRHKITHSDEQPFSCELCGVKCKNGGILRQHMFIHSEDKPFGCDLCDYRCKRASYLKTHKAIHTNKNGSSNHSQNLNQQQIHAQ